MYFTSLAVISWAPRRLIINSGKTTIPIANELTRLCIGIISPFQLRLRRGIEMSTDNLATHLARMAQSVTLLCWSGPLPRSEKFIAAGGTYYAMPALRYFESIWAAFFYAQAILRLKLDVVVLHFAGYGESAALAMTGLIRQSVIVFSVGSPMELVPHRFEEFKKFGLGGSINGIVVKGHYMAPAIEQFFGKPTYYIPNGVDTNKFYPESTHVSLNAEGKKWELVTVAALEQRKGIDLVMNALPEVIAQMGPVNYTIIGDGPERGHLEKQIHELGLEPYITLVGSHFDVRPYLNQADLFLLPSYGEGSPNAYLEALAMGLPTIVSNDPPYDEIAHPEFSIRVDRQNQQSMTTAIVQLLNDPSLRHKMGEAARREAEQVYAWPDVARSYLAIFHKLI
jgi:glycosyltransferase involved in cell wall biosynthesis